MSNWKVVKAADLVVIEDEDGPILSKSAPTGRRKQVYRIDVEDCDRDDCHEQCGKPQDCGYGVGSWGWLVAFIMVLFAFIVFFWILFYSLNPTWVQTNGSIDTAKVLLWAIVAAFAADLVLVAFKLIYDRYICRQIC